MENTPFPVTRRRAEELVAAHGSPLILLSLKQASQNYVTMQRLMPEVLPHYAMKSNPHPELVKTFAQLGSHFDVATVGEMEVLHKLGVPGERMLYANTIKPQQSLLRAKDLGCKGVTYDNHAELEKIADCWPGCPVLLRLRVENPDALVDLNAKFGALESDALSLLKAASDLGLKVLGLSFHVGSQTREATPFVRALETCRRVFDSAKEAGLNLTVLDMGGGWPIPERGQNIDASRLMTTVYAKAKELFPGVDLWAEPGRFFCGTTATLLTTVIGKEVRDGKAWYFLDDGLYGTFSGVIFDHWDFDLHFPRQGEEHLSVFAGPSCDSLDVMFRDRMAPDLHMGDLIMVPYAGAYTSASATTFNGFALTKILVLEEES